ncbi:hypothetical protein C4588_03605 [Candidatus Parcubacteria bacterium]|nr:MAG: hypothetical protein C4588_03605 [Candidatus Parcubacteria bacterium]
MACSKFIKPGGGRGRPSYQDRCTGCGVIYTEHPNQYRDRYAHILSQGISGVVAISTEDNSVSPGSTSDVLPIQGTSAA